MAIRVAINGFGRIGRMVFKAIFDHPQFDVVFINDLATPEVLAYLLQHDSVHGRWNKKISVEGHFLHVEDSRIQILSCRDPKELPYNELPTDIVVEATGHFTSEEKASMHLAAGATRVIVSAPSTDLPMIVMGVNHHIYDPEVHHIVSNASCTTNCLAPLVKVLQDEFGIVEGLMTTVHATTATQTTVDAPVAKKDLRGCRGILNNIIPSTTGAAKAVGKVIPELNGKLTGTAFRVPVSDVSVVDLTVRLQKGASLDQVAQAMKGASEKHLKGILGYTEEQVVSTDFIGCPLSSIYDKLASIELNPHYHKIVAWYDNEWGYASRICDLMCYMMGET